MDFDFRPAKIYLTAEIASLDALKAKLQQVLSLLPDDTAGWIPSSTSTPPASSVPPDSPAPPASSVPPDSPVPLVNSTPPTTTPPA